MILYRPLYISGWDEEDFALVMFYDEDKSKIWKEKIGMRDYIGLHCMYYEIKELGELSEYP
jgi:hypothetical protein